MRCGGGGGGGVVRREVRYGGKLEEFKRKKIILR